MSLARAIGAKLGPRVGGASSGAIKSFHNTFSKGKIRLFIALLYDGL